MNNKVIGGKYLGYKVCGDGDRNILYIRQGKNKIPLTNEYVYSYEFLVTQGGTLISSSSKTYVIIWVDGGKSVITIPDAWSDLFINGCESGGIKLSNSEIRKRGIVGFMIGALIFFVFAILVAGLYG